MRFHPYKQTSLKNNSVEKLKPRYYGPYKVVRKVWEVPYGLELPKGSEIHNVFHVSCLKKSLVQKIFTLEIIPPLDDEGQLTLVPKNILKIRERRLISRTIKEYLVQWKDIPSEDSTWEEENIFQHPYIKLFEYKQSWVGRNVMSPFK